MVHRRGGGAYEINHRPRSTSFDTRKWSLTDPEIEVQLISKSFAVSKTAADHWESNLAKEYTTTQLYDLPVQKKFNHYLYNGSGSDCLTWSPGRPRLLEDEGVLPKRSKESFEALVKTVRDDPNYWVPAEPGAKFYK